MKPYEGGVFITACGELVGPLNPTDLRDFIYDFYINKLSRTVWWNEEGIAEYEEEGDRCPMYNIVGLPDEELKIEDFV